MTELITRPEKVTPEWLTAALRADGSLEQGEVTNVRCEIIGTGKMGDNARFTLTYSDDACEAPRTLVGKFPAADATARAMAGAQGAYYNEVMFYRHLAPRTAMSTPRIYASEISEDRMDFVILMEDMAPAQPGDNLVGESRAHAEIALGEAAKLACSFYGDESIGELHYVMTPARDDGGAFGMALLQQNWPKFVERFGVGLEAESIAFGERYVERHAHFATRFQGKKTLVHGDFRSENMLFGRDKVAVVDWQTYGESSALTDAAYFLGGSAKTADRREWERDLIEQYRVLLAQDGVELSAQECWDQYREQSMHGLLIIVLGASFSEPAERSDRMFMAMIRRHLQHCIDVGASEFLA